MKRPIKRTEKVRCTITLDKDVFVDSALFINNLSGFINKTLKEYIIYKTKELESNNKTTADSSSDNNLLCYKSNEDEKDYDPILEQFKNQYNINSYDELKKVIDTQWTKSNDN